MSKVAITIKTIERPGVLSQITDMIAFKWNKYYLYSFICRKR